MAADAPPPLAIAQPDGCIEQLLSIISDRNVQLEMLKSHLQEQTALCKLHADRAARAEALAPQQLAAWPPNLSPADLASLNALPPAERDAAWLRRLFVRTHTGASPPVGPYEVAGLYVDAFFWSRNAARPDEIVAAVARVFPGVTLVPTECGPRFRGLARAHVFPGAGAGRGPHATEHGDAYGAAADMPPASLPARSSLDPVAPVVAGLAPTDRGAYAPAAAPPPFSHCASSPADAPHRAAALAAKRKHVPDLSLVQREQPTSKRVRTAPAQAVKCEDPPDAVFPVGTPRPTSARIPALAQPGEERTPTQLHSFGSAMPPAASVRNSYADAQAQPRAGDPVPPDGHTEPQPHRILLSAPTPAPRTHEALTHRAQHFTDHGREFAALEQEVQQLSRPGVDSGGEAGLGMWDGD